MKQFISVLTFYFILSTFNLVAQPTIEWENSYGGSGFEYLYSMKATVDGGYILAGSSVSNDGDLTINKGAGDYWIVKIDSVGTLEWQKSYGGSENDEAYSIQQTTDGGYIVAGMSNSNDGDINDHNGSVTISDYWVLRLDNLGNIIWKKSYGGFAADIAYAVRQTNDGGFIVAGDSGGNYWIVKIDALGVVQWDKLLGGNGFDIAYSVQQTADGGYVVSGSTNSSDGDVSVNKGGLDYWVVKLDSLGNIIWEKSYGGSNHDNLPSVRNTLDNGFIVCGISNSNDGDVSQNINNTGGLWVVKTNQLGDILWEKFIDSISLGGGLPWTVNDVLHISLNNGVVIAGKTNYNNSMYWIGLLDAQGNQIWTKTMGGSGIDDARAVVQNSDGSYLVAGHTNSSDGDVSLNKGMSDFWVVKLSAVVSIDEIENTPSISIYPNPTNGIFTISSTEQINEVEVFNVLGKAVYSKKVTSKNIMVDLTPFPKGLYLVQLKTNMNSVTKKIVYE
jgi:hypothetical protein